MADPKVEMVAKNLVLAAMKVVYDPDTSKQLLQMMGNGQPPQSVARTALVVLKQMAQQVKGIPPEAVFQIAPVVVEFLVELGTAAGQLQMDKAMIAQATALVQQNAKAPQDQPVEQALEQAPAQPGGLIGTPQPEAA